MSSPPRLDHHVALRVSDLEAAIRFWTDGVGGTLATPPTRRSGGYFDLIFEPGCSVTNCYILFESGGLELFEFDQPDLPLPTSRQAGDAIMHFGVTVSDVPEALARVEAQGGRARAPVQHMMNRPDAPRFVYCESPDGHVFELLETDNRGVVELTLKTLAEAKES